MPAGGSIRMETSYYKALKQLNDATKVSDAIRAKEQPEEEQTEEEPRRHPTVLLWKDPVTGSTGFSL
jgi:hypothetical protein